MILVCDNNIHSKYADDINFLVVQFCDVSLAATFARTGNEPMTIKWLLIYPRPRIGLYTVFPQRYCPLRFHLWSSTDGIKFFNHIRSYMSLHSLHYRVNFKVANITFRTPHSSQPAYLFSALHAHHSTRSLSLSNTNLSVRVVSTSLGARSFSIAGSRFGTLSFQLSERPPAQLLSAVI